MIPSELPAKSQTPWFANLKRSALVACIGAILGLILPFLNLIQTTEAISTTNAVWRWTRIPVVVFVSLFTAILPIFYYALYREGRILRIPKRLRLLALLGAFTDSVIMVAALPQWIGPLSDYWQVIKTLDWKTGAASLTTLVRDPRTLTQLSTALGAFATVAYILLLIAIFCQQNDDLWDAGVPNSRLLDRATKVAVVAWGLVLVVVLIGLVITPYTFSTLRKYALQIGRTTPAFGDLFFRQLRTLLQQASLFAAPYIVYKSQREGTESPVDASSRPEPLENGA
jgi:hypothetical protein